MAVYAYAQADLVTGIFYLLTGLLPDQQPMTSGRYFVNE